MIVRRTWTNDLHAFYSAVQMDRMGLRVAVHPPTDRNPSWEVWGQGGAINTDELDEWTDKRINGEV